MSLFEEINKSPYLTCYKTDTSAIVVTRKMEEADLNYIWSENKKSPFDNGLYLFQRDGYEFAAINILDGRKVMKGNYYHDYYVCLDNILAYVNNAIYIYIREIKDAVHHFHRRRFRKYLWRDLHKRRFQKCLMEIVKVI